MTVALRTLLLLSRRIDDVVAAHAALIGKASARIEAENAESTSGMRA